MIEATNRTEHWAADPVEATQPWEFDYVRHLYRGGAGAPLKIPTSEMRDRFGEVDLNRLPLVLKIKDVIEARICAGGSRTSARTTIDKIRNFYSWADESNSTLTLQNVAAQFLSWSDTLVSRFRVGAIKQLTAYGVACIVSGVLDEVLDLEVGLIRQTRLRRRVTDGMTRGVDIEQAFTFGRTLCDVCEALTVKAIRGSLPVPILFKTGQLVNHWSGLRAIENLKNKPCRSTVADRVKGVLNMRHAWELDTSNRTRKSLINLRIQSEMLIFIAQTGMNPAQARKLTIGHFSYESHSDGYLVRRVYKERKQGEVTFEIYTEYRSFFERYLSWLKDIFPDGDSDLVFPMIATGTSQRRSLNGVCENLKAVRSICRTIGAPYVVPRDLRKVRLNWLARRSGDLDQTAQMAQNSKEVLLRHYLKPDVQVAAVEITRFFQRQDGAARLAPGPGVCIEPTPSPLPSSAKGSPDPDCVSPSGCLFCSHQRDIDSLDHIWSLMTYRHLKTMELATYRRSEKEDAVHPANTVLDRLSEKIKLFEESSPVRREWGAIARDRVREGDYHAMWSGFIELMEALL